MISTGTGRWLPPCTCGRGLLLGMVLSVGTTAALTQTSNVSDAAAQRETAYSQELSRRADKIVGTLGIEDIPKATRVKDIIVQQYRALREIHAARDGRIGSATQQSGAGNESTTASIKSARDEAKSKLDRLHQEYLVLLAKELSSDQIDRVKNGMTYGVLPLTYGVYLKMCPDLTEAQKTQIKAWLVEARELAMDGGSSEEKHAVFGKYKGRINNYLSAAGYDLKKAEQNLKQPRDSASEPKTK